jgi:hypothetical protein
MNTTYATRDEAIYREITEALGELAADHDVDAIADEVLGNYAQGYALQVDVDEFWTIVANHAL